MSTPRMAKEVLNRRVKISKNGRPYIDMADLVAMLERIEKPEKEETDSKADQAKRNGDTSTQSEPKTASHQR